MGVVGGVADGWVGGGVMVQPFTDISFILVCLLLFYLFYFFDGNH